MRNLEIRRQLWTMGTVAVFAALGIPAQSSAVEPSARFSIDGIGVAARMHMNLGASHAMVVKHRVKSLCRAIKRDGRSTKRRFHRHRSRYTEASEALDAALAFQKEQASSGNHSKLLTSSEQTDLFRALAKVERQLARNHFADSVTLNDVFAKHRQLRENISQLAEVSEFSSDGVKRAMHQERRYAAEKRFSELLARSKEGVRQVVVLAEPRTAEPSLLSRFAEAVQPTNKLYLGVKRWLQRRAKQRFENAIVSAGENLKALEDMTLLYADESGKPGDVFTKNPSAAHDRMAAQTKLQQLFHHLAEMTVLFEIPTLNPHPSSAMPFVGADWLKSVENAYENVTNMGYHSPVIAKDRELPAQFELSYIEAVECGHSNAARTIERQANRVMGGKKSVINESVKKVGAVRRERARRLIENTAELTRLIRETNVHTLPMDTIRAHAHAIRKELETADPAAEKVELTGAIQQQLSEHVVSSVNRLAVVSGDIETIDALLGALKAVEESGGKNGIAINDVFHHASNKRHTKRARNMLHSRAERDLAFWASRSDYLGRDEAHASVKAAYQFIALAYGKKKATTVIEEMLATETLNATLRLGDKRGTVDNFMDTVKKLVSLEAMVSEAIATNGNPNELTDANAIITQTLVGMLNIEIPTSRSVFCASKDTIARIGRYARAFSQVQQNSHSGTSVGQPTPERYAKAFVRACRRASIMEFAEGGKLEALAQALAPALSAADKEVLETRRGHYRQHQRLSKYTY